jgi:hypothetical protein
MSERPVDVAVRALLGRLLEDATFDGAAELLAQVPHTRVLGGELSLLDLDVDPAALRAVCPDGPIPIQGVAEEPDGSPLGFVLVWVRTGYIGGLECAWVTDEPPLEVYRPDQVRVEASGG